MGKKREKLEDRLDGLECDLMDILEILLNVVLKSDERARARLETVLAGLKESHGYD